MLSVRTLWDFVRQVPCLHPTQAPEIFGPTDLNAQSGNQSLAVGLNADGTVTVLRWPRPSFYDQIKYHTTSRRKPRLGAVPNAGAFLGLVVEDADGRRTEWLRDWETSQRYAHPLSDAVVTEHRAPALGLTATVADVVHRDADVLRREVTVSRDAAAADATHLVAFENAAPVVTKDERHPVQDWCKEGRHHDAAAYRPGPDAVVHATAGVDESTGEQRSVAIAAAVDGSDAHQVGGDADLDGWFSSAPTDAHRDAADGELSGSDSHEGHTTSALRRPLTFADGEASATAFLCAAESELAVLDVLADARDREAAAVRREKRAWFDDLVGDAPMPDTEDDDVLAVAKRALVTLVTNYDPESGAIVASIATQSPYGLDWPRDGAYFNHVLDTLGLTEWAGKRARWYASLQEHPDAPPAHNHRNTPDGNWAMNYYADGTVGGPIPFEIDQTGYAVWSLWDHYTVVEDESYLRDVYPAIRRAADFFVDYRDDDTGLHRRAYEDDNLVPSQTIVGAGPVWLGLDAAANAAERLDEADDAARFRERRDELGDAIDEHLWNERVGAYAGGHPDPAIIEGIPYLSGFLRRLPLVPEAGADASVVWPIGFKPVDHPRMERHLERVWERTSPTWAEPAADRRHVGLYETKGLISMARAVRDDPETMADVRRGVRWVASEHATADTHVMGENWLHRGGEIVTGVSQPHTWSQLLLYYASLEAFPPAGLPDLDPGEGAVEYLRGTAD